MPILAAERIIAGYGKKTVISDVSFAIEPGEIVALLGHNGAGKTTTLKALMGLLPFRRGTLELAGESINHASTAERIRLGLRLLPAGRGIFPDLSVEDNIDVVAVRNCDGRDMFGPPQVYDLLPVLRERRATIAGKMSGGQQQMLALSLTLLGTPRVLLLDEPSIGLAPNLVERMFEQLRALSLAHALATILVEQNVAAAMKIADRLLIMNNGTIVFDGSPERARATNVWQYF
jgi:ABC-type branched-subunit amino acid transport system ATPase component